MTVRKMDLRSRDTRPEAGDRFIVSDEDTVLLSAAELDRVVGAGSKPGASSGNGIGGEYPRPRPK